MRSSGSSGSGRVVSSCCVAVRPELLVFTPGAGPANYSLFLSTAAGCVSLTRIRKGEQHLLLWELECSLFSSGCAPVSEAARDVGAMGRARARTLHLICYNARGLRRQFIHARLHLGRVRHGELLAKVEGLPDLQRPAQRVNHHTAAWELPSQRAPWTRARWCRL